MTPRQRASISRSWTRLSSASPKNPSRSPRTKGRTLFPRQRDLHVVPGLIPANGEHDAARAARLDHLPPQLGGGVHGGTAQAEDAVAAPEPDAGDGAVRPDLRHDHAVRVLLRREADER